MGQQERYVPFIGIHSTTRLIHPNWGAYMYSDHNYSITHIEVYNGLGQRNVTAPEHQHGCI